MAERHADRRPRRKPGAAGPLVIYGLHAVREALRNPRRTVLSLRATPNAALRLAPEIAARGLAVTAAARRDLDRLAGAGAVHQGVAIEVEPLAPADLADRLARPGPATLIVLDQVTDPRNVGAILRLAAAFAADGIVVTRHHRPQETGVLAKAASGGLEHVPVHEIGNLARALEQMHEAGFAVIGLDSDGDVEFGAVADGDRCALVLGAEGAGLRRLTRAHCDHLARIDLPGPVRSVNVATAAALALQTLRFRRGEK